MDAGNKLRLHDEPAFLRESLIFGKYFVFLALQYLACPLGMEVSRSEEVMGQKLTASLMLLGTEHLGNLGLSRKSHVPRLGLLRVGQAGWEEVALC